MQHTYCNTDNTTHILQYRKCNTHIPIHTTHHNLAALYIATQHNTHFTIQTTQHTYYNTNNTTHILWYRQYNTRTKIQTTQHTYINTNKTKHILRYRQCNAHIHIHFSSTIWCSLYRTGAGVMALVSTLWHWCQVRHWGQKIGTGGQVKEPVP